MNDNDGLFLDEDYSAPTETFWTWLGGLFVLGVVIGACYAVLKVARG